MSYTLGRWWRSLGAKSPEERPAAPARPVPLWGPETPDHGAPPSGRRSDGGRTGRRRAVVGPADAPVSATVIVERPVDDNATVAFQGNRYSVQPGLSGTTLELRHRLPSSTLQVHAASGALLVSHRLAPVITGTMVRTPEHRTALESVVLSSFTTARPCDTKANRPPGPESLAEAARLLGTEGREVTVDPVGLCRPGRGHPISDNSLYQQARGHLAYLRMAAAAEALPAELEYATSQKLGHTAFLERILQVEVAATEIRRRASLERFASLPSPFRLEDFDFDAQPSIDKKLVNELATLRFLEDATNVLFIGPPGVGKTMLAVALAPGLHSTRAIALLTQRRQTWWPAVTGRPSKRGGPPPCASSPDPDCWSSTRSATCPWPTRQLPPSSR